MAYTRLSGPETLRLPGENRMVLTREDYMVWLDRMLTEGGRVASISLDHDPIPARVEAGRWLVDCHCGAGALTRPDWHLACCGACGTVYDAVIFPPDHEDIEQRLLAIPLRGAQNWDPQRSER